MAGRAASLSPYRHGVFLNKKRKFHFANRRSMVPKAAGDEVGKYSCSLEASVVWNTVVASHTWNNYALLLAL